jgi:chromosomal replication initiator protein
MNTAWNLMVSTLKDKLSDPNFQIFFNSTEPVTFTDNILTLKVDNHFSKGWLLEKCAPLIKEAFKNNEYSNLVLDIIIDEEKKDVEIESDPLPFFKPKKEVSLKNNLNPKFTFQNFIVGSNNRFAHAAAVAVAKNPAKAYNPLFIYGSVGIGKTHLLHAICWQLMAKNPTIKINLITSEKFTNELINALKDKNVKNFKNKYRNTDILLVDDIQFIAGKETTQEEFFHTFNELHGTNKQIILTSDRPPKDIPTLQDRLRTRFSWGLSADIQPPELETRIAILRKIVELNSIIISDEILHFIATQIQTNVRELEGALTRVVAYASLLNTEVSLSIASNVIRDIVTIKQERPLTINLIKRRVCDYFDINFDALSSKTRTKELAYNRQIAMYLARELTNVSLPKIGENFGNRDHSTVMHACDKIRSLIDSDENTRNVINILISAIKNNVD